MHRRSVVIAILGVLPPLILVAWSANQTLKQFYDPCFQWGMPTEASLSLSPEDPYRSIGGTAETKDQAVMRLILIHGGIVIASLLGVLGVLIVRPVVSVLGAGLILLESIPLVFSFGWLTVFASGLLLVASRDSASISPTATLARRAIGSLSGVAVLPFLPGLLSLAPVSFVWVAALLFVVAVGWWPMPKPKTS